MVRSPNIQDLYDAFYKAGAVSLPSYKPHCVKITFKEEQAKEEVVYAGTPPIMPFAASEIFEANISDWRLLTAKSKDCKTVYEVSLDFKENQLKFTPGDTIGVIPQNRMSEVEAIISHLNLQLHADQTYELVADGKAKVPPFLPTKSSIRHVLTHCLDLRSVVKKLFLLALSKHTKDESEKQLLEYLCCKEGSTMYNTFVLEKNLCVLDIFHTFKSCHPPIEVLFKNLPRLLPRPYSIVNSQKTNENVIKICFSVKKLESERKGLTTGFLEDLIRNDLLENSFKNLSINSAKVADLKKVKIYLRSNMNRFKLPENKQNLLLIGPGTGVAPFIGFLEELRTRKGNGLDIGETWLFFGCRDPKLDFIYEKEIRNCVNDGILSRLHTAFSRIENGDVKYVQDAILCEAEKVAKYIEDGAMVFICGDLKTMASAVRETLKLCFTKFLLKNNEDAEKYMKDLESSKKYITDIWS